MCTVAHVHYKPVCLCSIMTIAVFQHRLMIQWEPDIVCEDDVSVIVRCDRPDDFNKTIEWNFETRQLLSTLEKSQHPGECLLEAGFFFN